MKSKIIKILLFLFVGLECLAITNRERIEKDLRKLNITDSTMIAQTINIDEKLGDKLLQGETIEGTLNELKKLVDKTPKNFYISYQIVRYYLETEKNKIISENKIKISDLKAIYEKAQSDYKHSYLMYKLYISLLSFIFSISVFLILYKLYVNKKSKNSPYTIIFSVAAFAYGLMLLEVTLLFISYIIP